MGDETLLRRLLRIGRRRCCLCGFRECGLDERSSQSGLPYPAFPFGSSIAKAGMRELIESGLEKSDLQLPSPDETLQKLPELVFSWDVVFVVQLGLIQMYFYP